MQRNLLTIQVSNNDKIAAMLNRLPDKLADCVSDAIAEYMIEEYQKYPPYKHVSRKRAFGRTFESKRQQRYFFWALQAGIIQIGNHRTHRLQKGWKQKGKGKDSVIVNEVPYSPFVQGDSFIQSRQLGLVGWQQFDEVYESKLNKPRLGTIGKIIFKTVKKAIQEVGLQTD